MMLLLITGSSVGYARPQSRIVLSIVGGFSDVASQQYNFAGGNAASITLFGSAFPASAVRLSYSVDASVQGNSVSGTAEFSLNGQGELASLISIEGQAQLIGMVPAVGLPLSDTSNPLACLHDGCTSQVPGFLLGLADISGSLNGQVVLLQGVPLLFESPYLNAFGGLLFIGTPDGSISIATDYNSAIAQWSGVKTSGNVFNDGGGKAIGKFQVSSSLRENLLTGTEGDRGQIVLSGFKGSNKFLNSAGDFVGVSTIPSTTGPDCTSSVSDQLAAAFGTSLTLPPNTCTITGSISQGSFSLNGSVGKTEIDGQFVNNWSEPAVSFVGSLSAALHRGGP